MRLTCLLYVLIPLNLMCSEVWFDSKGDFGVKVSLEHNNISIDESLKIDVDIQHPYNFEVDEDEIRHSLIRDYNFRIFEEENSIKKSDEFIHRNIIYHLDPRMIGTFNIGLIRFKFNNIQNSENVGADFYSDLFSVSVKDVNVNFDNSLKLHSININPLLRLSDDSKILQINNDVEYLETLKKRNMLIKSAVISVISMILMFVFRYKIYFSYLNFLKLLKHIFLSKEDVSKDLEALIKSDLIEKENWKDFYSILINLAKSHLEVKYKIKCAGRSTTEFLKSLYNMHILNKEECAVFKKFMLKVDLIKFANQQSSPEECYEAISYIRKFIMR